MLKCAIFKNTQNLTWPSFFLFKNFKTFVQSKPGAVSWNMIMLILLLNFCAMEKIKNFKSEKQTS